MQFLQVCCKIWSSRRSGREGCGCEIFAEERTSFGNIAGARQVCLTVKPFLSTSWKKALSRFAITLAWVQVNHYEANTRKCKQRMKDVQRLSHHLEKTYKKCSAVLQNCETIRIWASSWEVSLVSVNDDLTRKEKLLGALLYIIVDSRYANCSAWSQTRWTWCAINQNKIKTRSNHKY